MPKKAKSPKGAEQETSKEVAVIKQEVVPAWTPEQVELIKSTVAKGATDNELQLFLYTAKRTGLDPLTKQIHFVKRGSNMTIQTGIDGYRAIAERTGQLAGIEDPIYEDVNGKHPTKATVTVYRMVKSTKASFTASARWDEYAPTGGQGFMWAKMPYLMLGKVAESLALRKAFPLNLSGIYTSEEMDQANQPASNPQPLPISDVTYESKEKPLPPKTISLKTKIAHLCKLLGIEPEFMKEAIKEKTNLEPIEENFQEIFNRLKVIVDLNKEAKNK